MGRPQQKVNMIRDQSPSKALGLCPSDNVAQSVQKGLPIPIISKYLSSLKASGNDMLENPWRIKSG